MSKFVVVGAGPVGTRTARLLADQGHSVVLVTRRGTGPLHEHISWVAADASDATRMTELTHGAAAIFNCANPPYHRWATEWPPLADSLLEAATRTGAVLVTMSNLYGYGPVNGPMTEDLELAATSVKGRVRAQMWRDALAAHERGDARVTEVRASDFIGEGAMSLVGDRAVTRIVRGAPIMVVGDLDAPHSWTFLDDVAAALVAAATNERAWGHAWHAPTNAPQSIRELVNGLADASGLPRVKVSSASSLMVRTLGLFNPQMRELVEVLYQFQSPFVLDDNASRCVLGLEPTPWFTALRATVGPFTLGADYANSLSPRGAA